MTTCSCRAIGAQVKLLRVLQERMIRPVGGDQEVPFEVVPRPDLDHAVAGNKSRAARVLGQDRRSLYRRLAALGALAAPAVMRGSRGAESAK